MDERTGSSDAIARFDADALLAGPRGRHLCLAVAYRLDATAWPPLFQTAFVSDADAERDALLTILRRIDTGPIERWRDPESFLEPMTQSVDGARYWQPPVEEDAVTADPDVLDALRPIAAAVASAPGARWWTSGVDLDRQRVTRTHPPTETQEADAAVQAAEALAAWRSASIRDDEQARRDRPDDPTAPFSGEWWSTPAMTRLPVSTRALPAAGSVGLLWSEDRLSDDAATLWDLRVTREVRVFELRAPSDWVELVRRYPLELTAARRHDWYAVTGRDGRWAVPDWQAIAGDFDAVHLTVLGYLGTAMRSLAVDDDLATVMAGFDPDATHWLSDAVELDAAHPRRWVQPDQLRAPGAWRPA